MSHEERFEWKLRFGVKQAKLKTGNIMHIGIEARLIDGQWGGIQQFIIGLASGLSQITDPGTRFTFFTYANHTAWLEPYVSGRCAIFPALIEQLLWAIL
jgi:hypothetical protein